jgi:hypothetical protein
MKLITFLLICIFPIFSFSQKQYTETEYDAASYSKYIVENEIVGNFGTILRLNQKTPNRLYPEDATAFTTPEDFSEFNNGNLLFLLASIGNTFQNLENNPNGTFSINVKNCSVQNYEDWPYDPLACYRVSLTGRVFIIDGPVTNTSNPNVQRFIQKHPAATNWIQSSPHMFYLCSMEITQIFYIGGYGNIHYIGPIDLDLYFSAKPIPPPYLDH